ncbi:MAG: serine hydrolase domain-containing protein [Acidobacteriota bacterium]
MKKLLMIVLLILLPSACLADVGSRFDSWVAPLVEDRHLAGAVLVKHRGEVLLHRAYGEADRERRLANRVTSRFAVGSISKQFTAAAILRLRDGGRLRLDDPVARYLSVETATARAVRVIDLLNHRSGIRRDLPEDWPEKSRLETCRRLLDAEPEFDPGSRTSYSNGGFVVLACVVEAVTEESFEEHLRRTLFRPLGLSGTDVWDGLEGLAQQAVGYDPGGPRGELRPAPRRRLRHPGADGVVSTVADLARWTEALVAGEVLSERSTAEMLGDAGNGRGFGVAFYRRAGRSVIGHDGVTTGYTAFLEWYPQDELLVAYAGNIRTSGFEFLEDALPRLVLGGELPELDHPRRGLSWGRDDSLTGKYPVHDGLEIDIVRHSRGLELKGTGGYFTPLLEVGEDAYWYPALFARVRPLRNAHGEVTALQWRSVHGQEFEIPRRPPLQP